MSPAGGDGHALRPAVAGKPVLRSPAETQPPRATGGEEPRDYLWQILATLWPPPVTVRRSRRLARAGGAAELIVLPGERRPALVVPRRPRRAAAAALRNSKASAGTRDRLQLYTVALAAGAGLTDLLPGRIRIEREVAGPDADITSHLRAVLGRDVVVSLRVGAPRANRKPVLQALAPDGEVLGFVKVGVSPLTRRLVRAEADALALLASLPRSRLDTPRLLYHGQWRGHEVLLQEAFRPGRPARGHAELSGAMAELAQIRGVSRQPLAASPYLRRLRSRVEALASGEFTGPLGQAAGLLAAGAPALAFGCWHGDWTPWNMTMAGDHAQVWDWERFGTGVPVGFDAVHWWLQGAIARGGMDPRAAAERAMAGAPEILVPFGLDADTARRVAALYLAEIATRYLEDGQAEAGARLGRIGGWLMPVLMRHAQRLGGPGPP